jgi:lysophospholipase L1-like esterase
LLGTNDVGVADSGRYASDINDLMRAVPRDDRVFWVGVGIGVHAHFPKPGAHWRAATFNQTLPDLATRWPQLTYVDFALAAASPDIVDFDGVHLGSLGRQVRADLIVNALLAPLPQRVENAPKPTHPCGSGR